MSNPNFHFSTQIRGKPKRKLMMQQKGTPFVQGTTGADTVSGSGGVKYAVGIRAPHHPVALNAASLIQSELHKPCDHVTSLEAPAFCAGDRSALSHLQQQAQAPVISVHVSQVDMQASMDVCENSRCFGEEGSGSLFCQQGPKYAVTEKVAQVELIRSMEECEKSHCFGDKGNNLMSCEQGSEYAAPHKTTETLTQADAVVGQHTIVSQAHTATIMHPSSAGMTYCKGDSRTGAQYTSSGNCTSGVCYTEGESTTLPYTWSNMVACEMSRSFGAAGTSRYTLTSMAECEMSRSYGRSGTADEPIMRAECGEYPYVAGEERSGRIYTERVPNGTAPGKHDRISEAGDSLVKCNQGEKVVKGQIVTGYSYAAPATGAQLIVSTDAPNPYCGPVTGSSYTS